MALAGDLGLVSNAQYLRVAAQLAQQAPDNFGDTAADAHVDFIEDQAGHGEVAGADHLNGQAARTPPRRPLCPAEGLAGVGGEQNSTSSTIGAVERSGALRYGSFHAQCGELFLDLLGE